jgi:tetratricopeptide (TPR) repeat protein
MRKSQILLSIILVGPVIGCAPMAKKPLEKIVEVPDERFVNNYLQRGLEYEDKGDLVEALTQYKLAMTVSPSNQEVTENHNRVEMELRRSAEEHYRLGLNFHKRGKYGHARQQFLIALRLWPDYPEVISILTSRKRIQIKRYIVHTIKPGENLSKVAMMYYGDHHKFSIIAKYNNLTDATRINAGEKIKVPEIEGVDFLIGKEALKTDEPEVADSGFWYWEEYALREQESGKEPELKAKQKEEEPVEYVAFYRDHGVDLFKEKKYQEAIVEFNKVLNVYSEDRVAREYSYEAHFQQGMDLFEKKDYLAARDQFEACLRYRDDCQKCHGYIKKSENLYKEMHYKKGIQFFEKELLLEAIEEWELVKVIDTKYKTVDYLIKKAKTILKKMEEIKESQREEK